MAVAEAEAQVVAADLPALAEVWAVALAAVLAVAADIPVPLALPAAQAAAAEG